MTQRVVVTGRGIVAPLGHCVADFSAALARGECGIGPIQSFDASALSIQIAAEVKGFAAESFFPRGELMLLDRFSQLGAVAAREAIAESGLVFAGDLGLRTGAIVGSSVGGLLGLEDGYRRLFAEQLPNVHPFTVPKLIPNGVVGQITIEHGIRGPAFAVSSACASAAHAIGVAFDLVRRGAVDIAVTGGAEACLCLGTLRGWEGLKALARDACRPFSKQRSGTVLGEGAAILVLENLAHARARGATPLCEIAGFGMSADATHMLQPSADGMSRALSAALADAALGPEAVDYVNAHGTGTPANDVMETRALRSVFGAHAEKLAISSTKSMHGHGLGAAGAIELVATLSALESGLIPPTIHYTEPDPECDLDWVPNQARVRDIGVALSSSFAFGGVNAVLAVRRLGS